MKGKVEAIQTKMGDKEKYSVSLIITLKKGLTYERSEAILADFRAKYLGKTLEITEPNSPI